MNVGAAVERAAQPARRVWASEMGRFVVLTVYYVAIIAGLANIYGSNRPKPTPFVYQEF